MFDEIVARTLPDGVYLTAVKQTGTAKLRFDGVAQSSTRVSSFMRNIDASQLAEIRTSRWCRPAQNNGHRFQFKSP